MTSAGLGPTQRLIDATRYSLQGLKSAWRMQAPFRYECYIMIIVVPLGWSLGKSGTERSLLIGSWIFVIVIELINSAVETIVDRIGVELNELSGRAKDSAVVFCAIALSATIWLILCVS
jgi:diacylglycerol kinase (ATP)